MMSFEKPNQNTDLKSTILSDWAWANLVYDFVISRNKADIKKITLDPSGLMADVKQTDNVYEKK
jgi:hypothetical protein